MDTDIIAFISSVFNLPTDKMTEDAYFTNDLGLNSFDLVVLACEIEEKYNINISTDDYPRLQTVGGALKFIESKLV